MPTVKLESIGGRWQRNSAGQVGSSQLLDAESLDRSGISYSLVGRELERILGLPNGLEMSRPASQG